jgi:hypothetical protein
LLVAPRGRQKKKATTGNVRFGVLLVFEFFVSFKPGDVPDLLPVVAFLLFSKVFINRRFAATGR